MKQKPHFTRTFNCAGCGREVTVPVWPHRTRCDECERPPEQEAKAA